MLIVSLYNPKNHRSSELEVGSKGLMIRNAAPNDRRDLEKAIDPLNLRGAPWRLESFEKDHDVNVGFVFITPGDERFPSAVASYFRASGNAARVFNDPKRAELWRLLYVVPIENDVRNGLLANLNAMSRAEIDDLVEQFSLAKSKLARPLTDDHIPLPPVAS